MIRRHADLTLWKVLMLGALSITVMIDTVHSSVPSAHSAQTSDHIIFGILFRDAFDAQRLAGEAEQRGDKRTAGAWRRFHQNQIELSDAALAVLNRIAAECERELEDQDAKAKSLIENRRVRYYLYGKVPASLKLAPASKKLLKMQQQRNAIILRHRDRLREALDAEVFARLEGLAQSVISNGKRMSGNNDQKQPREKQQANTPTALILKYTSIAYDAWSNIVIGRAALQLDYLSQEYYEGGVRGELKDANGSILSADYQEDTDRDGFATVNLHIDGIDQMHFGIHSTHTLNLLIRKDTSDGTHYVDYFNFTAYSPS